jgi:hypothetical protein
MKTEAAHARKSRKDPLGLEVVNYRVKERLRHVGQFAFHVINESVEFFAGGHSSRESKSEAIGKRIGAVGCRGTL